MRSIGSVPIAAVAVTAFLPLACAGESGPEEAGGDSGEMQSRLEQFALVALGFDESMLDADQRRVIRELVEASGHLDDIFKLQAWRGNADADELVPKGDDPESAATREYYDIMYGPWDRLTGEEPFLEGVGDKPHGAGFYPEDMTREEFQEWIAANPDDEATFKSETTLIHRTEGGELVAEPYRVAYASHLEAASENLLAAAERATNASLKRFLELRAGALLSDDFYDSEVAWMRLNDNLIEPTLGPYENYEDQLFGYKISYESFIGLKDPVESERLAGLVESLPALEAALPIPDEHKYLDRSFVSPISVVTLIYASGETRAGIQTIAFNLPNDPRVREGEGSKKVMLRNVIDAKFETILKPIAERVLVPEQAAKISVDPYFTRVLMHELAHGLGPDYVTDQPGLTARQALQDRYAAMEEAKADAVGTNSLRILTRQGLYDEAFLEEVYIDHVADMFRCVRFGITEAHGLGCLTQFNFLRERGAITYDEYTGLFAADLEIIPVAIAEMAHVYLMMQATGDYDGAGAFVEKYGTISPEMQGALDRLAETVPVDIRPSYQVEEMMADW
ncbi:MAG: peptidase [Gemmatimonadetes bacterium]|nr:peptidase [Gemmatimonadota bacterium]